MDPTTVPPPSPQSPPYLPQNPRTPPDASIEASAFQKREPSTRRNTDSFKALVFNLAGRLLPAHQSLIRRRFDDILPHELLVPDHPSYADMILTALWELKAEGGSSEEAISHFIEKEYHELPWAHATILKHHLRDLCKTGKITMTDDECYIRCSSIAKPEPPSPSPSSPSSTSSSSGSLCTSPSSSSSSLSWGDPYRTKKRKKRKGRKGRKSKMVQVSGRGRGRGKGRGRKPVTIQVGQRGRGRGRGRGRFDVEGRKKLEEPKEGTEDQNEVTVIEVEDYAILDGDVPDVDDLNVQSDFGVTGLEVDVSDAKVNEHVDVGVTGLEVDVSDTKVDEHVDVGVTVLEVDVSNAKVDEHVDVGVTVLEVDVSDAKVDEHVEQLERNEEKGALATKHNQQEEIQQSDVVERLTLGEERLVDDENLHEEQDLVMTQCVEPNKQLDLTKEQEETKEQSADLHDDDATEEPDHPQDLVMMQCVEPNKQLDSLTKEQEETKEPSADLHVDDVTEEPDHPQEQCVENTEESPQPCEQDQLEIVEAEPAAQEEHQTEVNQKETMLAEVQQEPIVEITEEQNGRCIQHTEISEKDSLQEKDKPVRNEENMTSSGSTTEGSRRPSRPGLRSSSKKEDAPPNSKKQLELVTPVRRILRSHKTVSEAAVITEVPNHSKEQETPSGRTRSSKRKPVTAEVEQVPSTRKTRRTGL